VQTMRGVHTLRSGQVEMTGSVHLQADGEYAGRLPARFEIVSNAITLLMPSSYK
jgi:diacylglycerol kinase family enzyme